MPYLFLIEGTLSAKVVTKFFPFVIENKIFITFTQILHGDIMINVLCLYNSTSNEESYHHRLTSSRGGIRIANVRSRSVRCPSICYVNLPFVRPPVEPLYKFVEIRKFCSQFRAITMDFNFFCVLYFLWLYNFRWRLNSCVNNYKIWKITGLEHNNIKVANMWVKD